MTQNEKNHLCACALTMAAAAEMAMDQWLKAEGYEFRGETKQFYNNLFKSVQNARHWFERFTDKTTTILFDLHGSGDGMARIDKMRADAAGMDRLFFTIANSSAIGYPIESVEDAVNRVIDAEEDSERIVSQEVIDKFKIK